MSKRLLRTSLLTLAAIGVALATLVAVLFLTPFGARTVAMIGWSRAVGDPGLELSLGSTSGSLARGVTFHEVLLATHDGTRLVEADRVSARLGGVSLRSRRVELEGLLIEGAELLFVTGDDGKPVGWSGFAREGASTPPGGAAEPSDGPVAGAWDVRFDLALADVTVRVRDEATGFAMAAGPFGGAASGSLEEFEAALRGAVAFEFSSLGEPIAGEFEGLATLAADGLINVGSLVLRTNAGEALATGTVHLMGAARADSTGVPGADSTGVPGAAAPAEGPSADLKIESTHDLSRLAGLLGAAGASSGLEGMSGALSLSSEMRGPFVAPDYSTLLRAENVSLGGVDVGLVTASLRGDVTALEAESLHMEAMGGTVDASATVDFPGPGDDGFPLVRGRAKLKGLRLDRLAALAPDGDAGVSGTLDGTATVDWGAPGLSNVEASFDLSASRLVAAEKDLGSLSVRGRVAEGLLVSSGSCCAARFTADGRLTDDGFERLDISLAADDLAALGRAFGVAELAGNGTARLAVSDIGTSPALTGIAEFPDLRYGGSPGGPRPGRGVRTGRVVRRALRRLRLVAERHRVPERRGSVRRVRRCAFLRPRGGHRRFPSRSVVVCGGAFGACRRERRGGRSLRSDRQHRRTGAHRARAERHASGSLQFRRVARLCPAGRGRFHRHLRRGVRRGKLQRRGRPRHRNGLRRRRALRPREAHA